MLRWIGYSAGGLVPFLLLVGLGAFPAAHWTRHPGQESPTATIIEGGQRFDPHRDMVRPDVRRAFLEHSVTTVRSVGDPVGHQFGVLRRKRQIAQHALAGPRLFTAVPTFTAPGGHPDGMIHKATTGSSGTLRGR